MKSKKRPNNKTVKKKQKKQGGTNKTKTKTKTNKNKSKSSKKINCSPKPKDELNKFSCYVDEDLVELRDHWNARHLDIKIKTNDPKQIHKQLSNNLKDVCNNEACWLKQKTAFGRIKSNMSDSFAPESPEEWKSNPNEWLSSSDINKVMNQYERAYKCFDFMGPTPIDFDKIELNGECVWEELCNISIEGLKKKGKNKIGIIFNTDPHDKPGQHWISMFVNIKKKTIFFFDSTGDEAPKEVTALINKIVKQGAEMSPPINFKVDSNENVEHQYGTTECGVYSIFFIVHMLEDKMTEHYLKTHILKDEYMQNFRKVYFNDSL